MKILLVCKSLPIRLQGGIQTHVWKLSEHLVGLGHDISILTVGKWKQGEKRYTIEGRNIIEMPYVPMYWLPILPLFFEEWSFNVSAKNWIKRHETEFDIIHLQGRSGFLYPRSQHRTPIISTFHGLVTIENKHSMQAPTLQVKLHEKWASWYEKRQIRNSDALIAVSNEMLEEMEDLVGGKIKHAKIVSNGVNAVHKTSPNGAKYLSEENTLVFIGRLDPIKGIYNLVQAMKKVKSSVQLIMIGDSYERQNFEKHVYTEGVADRIRVMGALPNDSVLEWIKKSYAVILPSFHETQGIVLLEANACGKPVLASNVGGVKDVVRQGYNGMLFNPHDVDSITNAINTLFEMPEKAKKMGENGRDMVEKHYTWDKIVLQTENLYQKTISDFHPSKEETSYTLSHEKFEISQVG